MKRCAKIWAQDDEKIDREMYDCDNKGVAVCFALLFAVTAWTVGVMLAVAWFL